MKTTTIITVAVTIVTLCSSTQSRAQAFNSSSDGSYGPLNVTTNTTLDMPPNGIFNCTTITIANGATLKFRRNPLNTPVYLLATGNVTINGTIDVSGANGSQALAGEGGPGGFDGGQPAVTNGELPGDGLGPGAGKGGNFDDSRFYPGNAAYGTRSTTNFGQTNNGALYGNSLIVPLVGGSGGGGSPGNPGDGGSGGGGAILISSSTRADLGSSGRILARGGTRVNSFYGFGSGGAIRVVTPIFAGSGVLDVTGNDSRNGFGRIRIDSLDRSSWSFSFQGRVTYGSQMFVFPSVIPRLDIIEAAGQLIPEGTSATVQVQLPVGASTNQTVKVQARDFAGIVPINVVVTPDAGKSVTYPTQIDTGTGNPAQVTADVVIPAGIRSRINAWTR